ncbi:NAD-dependent epimerase/dehydratase family protein [Photobacterium sp. DNB23_23_1]
MKRVLVTGGNGFIGKELVKLLQEDFSVRASVRKLDENISDIFPSSTDVVATGNITDTTNWDDALAGVDVVIHLAARAHILADPSQSPLELFRQVNCKAALHLLREAAKQGVSRFVFVSSIGVNGNVTHGIPFNEQQTPTPVSDYAISKYEAEQQLTLEAKRLGVELVIVRPALVYGKKAPGNMARLAKLATVLPILPFGAVANSKSFVSVTNLVSLLKLCASHPAAVDQVFLAADSQTVSTKQLVNTLAEAAGKKTIQFPVPVAVMRFAAKLLGKGAIASQLFDDLEVDNSKAKELLGWELNDDLHSTLN